MSQSAGVLSALPGTALLAVSVDGLSSTVVGTRGGDRLSGFNERISTSACERTLSLVHASTVLWRRFRYAACACFALLVTDRSGRAIADGDVGSNWVRV
jgi:hypothetical protein